MCQRSAATCKCMHALGVGRSRAEVEAAQTARAQGDRGQGPKGEAGGQGGHGQGPGERAGVRASGASAAGRGAWGPALSSVTVVRQSGGGLQRVRMALAALDRGAGLTVSPRRDLWGACSRERRGKEPGRVAKVVPSISERDACSRLAAGIYARCM